MKTVAISLLLGLVAASALCRQANFPPADNSAEAQQIYEQLVENGLMTTRETE